MNNFNISHFKNLFDSFFLVDFELIENRRGGLNLLFSGFVYRKKIAFAKSTNWVCLQNNCNARVVTKNDSSSIRVGKNCHNHPPKYVNK